MPVAGWVVLPNHYHVLVDVQDFEALGPLLKKLHGATTRGWKLADQVTNARRVWYRYYDHAVRDEGEYCSILNYIHANPLHHGLVEDVYSWEWSSLHWYKQDRGVDWLQDTWKKHPPQKR